MKSAAFLVMALIPLATGCSQQEYLRGYVAGMDRQDQFCKANGRLDTLECQYDLTDVRANLKICQGTLDAYKFNGKGK